MQTIINNVICKEMHFRKRAAGSAVTKSAGDSVDDTPTTIIIEGEDYSYNYRAYGYDFSGYRGLYFRNNNNASAIYEIDVGSAGIYTITTIGNGANVSADLYVDNIHISQTTLTTSGTAEGDESASPDNQLVSELGTVELSKGKHIIKIMGNGSYYYMDRMVLIPNTIPNATAITVEGESYVDESGDNSEAYTPNGSDRAGVKIGVTRTSSSWATWNVEVATAGIYAITAFGTGYIVDGGDDDGGTLQGTLSINGGNEQTVSLTVHGRNDYVTYGENSTLGEFELSAGTNTIKLALSGGRYSMDYMVLTLGSETPTVTIEGEAYTTVGNSGIYEKDQGKAIHLGSGGFTEPLYATWSVPINTAGRYTIKAIGTGYTIDGSTAVTGTLYVDGTTIADAVSMNIHGGWNCFENPRETYLGTVELSQDIHTFRLEIDGGGYVMDKMMLTVEEILVLTEYVPYKKVYADGVLVFSAGNIVTYYVDGVAYQEEVECGNSCLSPTSFVPAKDGWDFLGWSSSADSEEVLESLVMDADPITLYAVFKYPDTEIALQAEIGSNTSKKNITITNDLYYKISVTGDGGSMNSAQLYKNNTISEGNIVLNTYGDNTYAETTSFEDSSEYLFYVNTNYAYSIPKGTLMLYGKTVVG